MTTPSSAQQSALAKDTAPPVHVAIIMDGNGRWATARGLPRLGGHQAGTENIRSVIQTFAELGVKYLTIFAFSTENWSRPETEVEGLWRLLGEVIAKQLDSLNKNGIRLRHLGRRDRLSPHLLKAIDHAVDVTQNNTRLTLNVALDYGGRSEIVEAARAMIATGVAPENVTEERFASFLYSAGIPDPDLVIRTGGEQRMSNFLIWQTAYAEFYATPTFWPDFGKAEIEKALEAYSRRHRRFGGVADGLPS